MDEALFRRGVLRWARGNRRTFPWRHSSDPYEVLVGEVLLQRTRGENVSSVYQSVIARWPTAADLARAHTASVRAVIRPLGLAKRVPVLKRLGRALADMPDVPLDPHELQKLPGVGPYGAHAVPVFAAGRDLPLVDWVIARVLRRYFGLPEGRRPNADKELWGLASRLAARGGARELWLGTLDLASAVCKPRPTCPECPLRRSCHYGRSVGTGG